MALDKLIVFSYSRGKKKMEERRKWTVNEASAQKGFEYSLSVIKKKLEILNIKAASADWATGLDETVSFDKAEKQRTNTRLTCTALSSAFCAQNTF